MNAPPALGQRPVGLAASVMVHPFAYVETPDIGEYSRVWAFAHVMAGAKVGARCNVGERAFVEAGAVIGSGVTIKNGVSVWDKVILEDDVFVGPSAVFTNHPHPRAFIKEGSRAFLPTWVRRGATLGAGAVIVCGHEIGAYAFVGAGACVIDDVLPHALVVGNPARQVGWVCTCAKTRVRLGGAQRGCEHCGFEFGSLVRPA